MVLEYRDFIVLKSRMKIIGGIEMIDKIRKYYIWNKDDRLLTNKAKDLKSQGIINIAMFLKNIVIYFG